MRTTLLRMVRKRFVIEALPNGTWYTYDNKRGRALQHLTTIRMLIYLIEVFYWHSFAMKKKKINKWERGLEISINQKMRKMQSKLYFILDGDNNPVETDAMTFGKWFQENKHRRIVKQDTPLKGVSVSTVFLGVNHAILNEVPLLFETTVFNGDHDGYCRRYSTYEQAQKGHQEVIEMIFEVA
jgi:hypothetical protein